jgi:hypothetical protein
LHDEISKDSTSQRLYNKDLIIFRSHHLLERLHFSDFVHVVSEAFIKIMEPDDPKDFENERSTYVVDEGKEDVISKVDKGKQHMVSGKDNPPNTVPSSERIPSASTTYSLVLGSELGLEAW